MYIQDHERICLDRFGNKFTHVHMFLDRYFKKFGPSHRILLHHERGIDLVVENFGEAARGPAEQHIKADVNCIPNDWREYDDPFFLNLELYEKFDRAFKKLYKLI